MDTRKMIALFLEDAINQYMGVFALEDLNKKLRDDGKQPIDEEQLKQIADETGFVVTKTEIDSVDQSSNTYIASNKDTIEETLRYPTKAFKRRSPTQARKRATVFGEDLFADKLDRAMVRMKDFGLYKLTDLGSKEALVTDWISAKEAQKRNKLLEDKKEPFRWFLS